MLGGGGAVLGLLSAPFLLGGGGGGGGSKRPAPLFPGPQGGPAHGLHPRFVVAEIWADKGEVGGAGVGVVLAGVPGVPVGRVGVGCVRRAALAVLDWLRCRGVGGRRPHERPGGAVVRM